jgi:hypothetical protein
VNWLWLSATLMALTAVVHSWLGEVRLIGPQVRARQSVLASPFARTITRYAWHVTSALMLVSALSVAWPGSPRGLVVATGAIWLALGLVSLAASRGRHVGWPVLSGAGIAALLGASF